MSLSAAVRSTALPLQTLLSEMLGHPIPIVCHADNMQAISAVKKGYSKKLRALTSAHQCSIGCLHEIYSGPEAAMDVVYHPTKTHKGDFFTKVLGPAQFTEARERIGLFKPKVQAAITPLKQ